MRRLAAFFLALLLSLTVAQPFVGAVGPAGTVECQFYNETTGRYDAAVAADRVNVTLNGETLVSDVPALIRAVNGSDGRTLLPVRAISEALGATVLWVQENRQVLIFNSEETIVLTLGSSQALVNGQVVELPGSVPAVAAKVDGVERTLVPLRFVSEQLHGEVDWDNATFTAKVTAYLPVEIVPTTFALNETGLDLAAQGEQAQLSVLFTPAGASAAVSWHSSNESVATVSAHGTVTAVGEGSAIIVASVSGLGEQRCPVKVSYRSGTEEKPAAKAEGYLLRITPDDKAQSLTLYLSTTPKYQLTDLGDRVVIDLQGFAIGSGEGGVMSPENAVVDRVRYAQHDSSLDPNYAYTTRVVLDLKNGCTYEKNIHIAVDTAQNALVVTVTPPETGGAAVELPGDWDPTAFTVALDAGHGGSASGATYENIKEKTLTLPMALRVGEILKEKGYNVIQTRTTDVYMDLYDRCDIANNAGADIFVSIHCNASSSNRGYQGAYTYSHPGSNRGAKLASCIQKQLVAATGAIDRGTLTNNYVVLRETTMAAALVETGFMSCHEELMKLSDPSYQEKIAQGVARGIEDYLATLPAKTGK